MYVVDADPLCTNCVACACNPIAAAPAAINPTRGQRATRVSCVDRMLRAKVHAKDDRIARHVCRADMKTNICYRIHRAVFHRQDD
jgi:hypothetical protein